MTIRGFALVCKSLHSIPIGTHIDFLARYRSRYLHQHVKSSSLAFNITTLLDKLLATEQAFRGTTLYLSCSQHRDPAP